MIKKETLSPNNFTKKTGSYSQGLAVSCGNAKWVFVTGQIAMDANGEVVSPNDIEGQTEYVFENIKTILAESGATLDDVVKVQIFLTDISLFGKVTPIRNKYLAVSQPVSTLVEVSSLVKDGCMIEIEVIAIKEI